MNEAQPSELICNMISRMDIGDFDDVETGVCVLVHPKTSAPTSSKITLAGPENISRKSIDDARGLKLRKLLHQTGKMPDAEPANEIEERDTDYLVACTLGWEITMDGNELEFSAENARKLYTNPKKRWVRRQVLAALNKSELFIASSEKP